MAHDAAYNCTGSARHADSDSMETSNDKNQTTRTSDDGGIRLFAVCKVSGIIHTYWKALSCTYIWFKHFRVDNFYYDTKSLRY